MLEDGALAREACRGISVEPRSVWCEMIAAERIDRDHDDVGAIEAPGGDRCIRGLAYRGELFSDGVRRRLWRWLPREVRPRHREAGSDAGGCGNPWPPSARRIARRRRRVRRRLALSRWAA